MIEVSDHFPPSIRDALLQVALWPDVMRNQRIDELTLQAHAQYPELIRHPEDTSMLGAWATAKAMARGFR